MLWWTVLLACSGGEASGDTAASAAPTPTPTPTPSPAPVPRPEPSTGSWSPPDGGVITLTTRDDLVLEADYRPAAAAGAPALCLVHMIPPGNDRSNWPTSFLDAVEAEGWAVIAFDRRGAGGSEGTAVDAYQGPAGKWDVEACALRLADDGYGALGIIGASNGTTSILDYAVWAPGEGLPVPVGLGYMTGGTYTEAQNALAEAPDTPAIFTYSTAEQAWSVGAQAHDPGTWAFEEYPTGDHGTLMFSAAPEVSDDLIAFFRTVLAR